MYSGIERLALAAAAIAVVWHVVEYHVLPALIARVNDLGALLNGAVR